MGVGGRERPFFLSKKRSAPISDLASKDLARARRSVRKRSKSMRFSQSTAIGPYVFSATKGLPFFSYSISTAKLFCGCKNHFFGWHGNVFEGRRKRDGDVHRAHAFYR